MTLFEKSLNFLLYILLAVCKENLDINSVTMAMVCKWWHAG